MEIEELESEALKLNPESRARLAEKLLDSLGSLEDENTRIWAGEALRSSADMDENPESGIAAEAVFGDEWSPVR